MKRYESYKDSGVKWLGEIPSHWELNRGKHYLYSKKTIVGADSQRYQRLALTLNGIIKRQDGDDIGLNPEKLDTYQIVDKDDLVFKLIDLENYKTSRVGLTPYDGIVSPAYIRLKSKGEINMRYMEYFYLNLWYRHIFNDLGTPGVRSNLSSLDLLNLNILIPCPKEQNSIVAYLDTATSKIDEAIAQQQKMIDLLNERKQIIINNAVTKGLNPNAPMKDSGIERIGLIPNHWITKRLEYCIDILPGYAFSSQDFVERGIKLLRGINVAPETIRWDDTVCWAKDLDESLEKYLLKENDLVLGLDRPWIGSGTRVTIVKKEDLPCLLVQRVCRIRVANDMSIKYLYYLLSNKLFYDALGVDTTGVSVPHLSTEQIKKVIMPIPMLSEQNSIVEYIEKQIVSVNNAILAANEQISLLQERKQIIINDVVTGKVKVV